MFMTTTRDHGATSAVPRSDHAAAFLDSLAAQDFARLVGALTPDATLRALLPSALCERAGAEVIAEQFVRWFGGTQDFELVEGTAGEVGDRLHLSWRLRLRAERLGTGWLTVEQQAYADTGDDGRISRMDLLCTGYRPEGDDG
jgi:SnoaL-like domain